MKNGINVKQLILWGLYDFANSIVMIVFFMYYSQWLVVEQGVSDFWFNMTFVGSSLLFLLTVPVAGSIIDKTKIGLPGLRIATIFSVLLYFVTGFIAVVYPSHYIITILTYSLATYFYLFSFTFYNPLLKDIAVPEHHGLASGWGNFSGWLGEIFGLVVAIPLVSGFVFFVGAPGRAQALMPSAILFLLFSLPMLIFFKESTTRVQVSINIKQEYKDVIKSFVKLCVAPGVGLFFLAYFFFNDAITTASNNFPIFVQKLYGVSDLTQTYLLLGIIVTSAIGAPVSGWLADKFGFKRVLLWILAGWVVVFPLLAIVKSFSLFIAVCVAMGLWFGAIWTITRAYLVQLTPPEMINQSFTYYTLMERLATFIGPISWGLVVTYVPKTDALNYRSAAALMTVFVIVGLFIARKLPDRRKTA